uniref:Mucin 5B, oligomeric mucus/gel-forming n=1 Tax=Cercocebus atys TaxID=9531 RepID=A0A2K5LM18_CERAT
MGALSTCRTLVLALAAVLLVQQAETQGPAEPSWGSAGHTTDGGAPTSSPTRRVSFVPPVTVFPSLSPLNPAHNGRVCSTWGDFHYKTFDGDVFRFPGLCNYVFSKHCGAAYEDFNVQLRRGLVGSRPVVTRVVIKAQGLVLEASNGSVLVNGQREELPYSRTGLLVEQSGDYVKVSIRLVLTFLWNGEDSALLLLPYSQLELDPKYANQTCGLCGDFNGLPVFNEFYAHNARLTPLQFGNLQKLDGPTEQCPDPLPLLASNCTDEEGICHHTLLGPAFAECHALVDSAPYLAACAQDLCRCPTCPCATFVEYSRQCAHAGGQPQNWRHPELCPRTCPVNMQHRECGSPCVDTCSNPQRAQLCEDHCVDGCFCPPGTVLDDVTHSGCLPLGQCPCTHGGRTYSPGTSVNTTCSSCTCSGGLWQCQDLPCPGTCSVQGGAHITTYDEKLYDLHGDCSYVLSKKCADGSFTVLAELRKCGLTDNENCLKAVTLSLDGGDTAIRVQADGSVFLNSIYTQLPLSAANITLFTPSSFFIVVHTVLGLQLLVQLVPLMQVFVRLDPAHQGQMCGLCGNFNQNQADDFAALSGVVEATGAAFANTWKAQAACANARNSFEDPCSLSVENENYARHWCSRLTDPTGSFSRCHSVINPKPFHSNCLFDTCNCERSEDCLCAALSSYVHACAAKGVQLSGWRDGVCTKYMQNCPKSQRYAYVVDACQPTCRGLSEADVTCSVSFVPVDGCTCPTGTFLNDAGACVPARECPCYVHGTVLAPGEVVHDEGAVCSCEGGKLSCLGASLQKSTGCVAPMVYLNCSNSSAGTPGAECLRSCHTLDVGCFSTHCVSGCVCPPGLVSDGSGGCIAEEDCPCVHNEATYKPGDTIRVDCNTCTCRNRRWECSHRLCLGTCVAYGDGHFITFDGERYSFEGSCEYILAQDYCGDDATHGTFRIVTENIPCGTTGTTCSKAIKLFVESYELILQEGAFKAVARGPGGDPPYKIRYMGIFLVIETRGMAVSWDRKTSVFIRLHQDYKGRVCGLCGNFDDHAMNDFATRSRSVVGDALEFGNSWKLSPSCPDALAPKDPCTANPFRKSWAQKQCSILHGPTFAACRSQVDSTKYYEACVNDACACDSGGDCECFCTAVAAYAQACHDAGLCVSWRTPDTCPLFCDFYNPHGGCEWHYQPCGAPCLKTCRNPSGHCLVDLPGLEGCYPKCPPSQPFFNEDQMKCVAQCGCYDRDGNYYDVGARVPTAENCQSCNCTPSGIQCAHSLEACTCTYEDRTYGYQDVIYNTTDGLGACLIAICGSNGTIVRKAVACPGTPATTPFTFTTSWVPHSTTSPALPVSTVCVREVCRWSSWYNGHHPEPGLGGGDFETFENLRQRGYQVCPVPADIECRAGQLPDMSLGELGQQVDCDRVRGLMCANSQQSPPLCHDYELRVLCCEYVPCGPSLAPGTSPQPSLSASTEPAVPTPTQTTATEKTTLWVIPSIQSTAALTSQTGSSSGPTTVTSLAPGTTTCQPRCQWTEWFDEDYPKSEQLGGDIESYDKIRAAGGHLCEQPKDIECQAESFPNWPLAQVGQKVHCDVRFGLVCRNWEQEGIFKMCYNYRIRVLCCSADHCGGRATTPPPATSLETATTTTTSTQVLFSTLQSTSSLGVTSTTAVPTLSKGLTSPRYTGTLGTATTGGPTVPAGSTEPTVPGVATSSIPTRSVLPGTTGSSGTWHPSQPPTPAPTTMATSRAHLTGTTSSSSKQPLTTSLAPTLSSELFTSQAKTSTPRTETTLSRLTETTTSQSTTRCQPKCEWTEWFDVDFPTSGVAGGDMETFENIRAAGGKMCWAPKSIECRAENYPEVSIDQIGQVLTCSLETGLICKNEDQTGRFNMCFNYNVRVLCCDDYSHCPHTAAPTPTSSTQAPRLTSMGATSPTVTASTAIATWSTNTGSTATTPTSTGSIATTPMSTGSTATTPTSTGSTVTVPMSTGSTAATPRSTGSMATTPTSTGSIATTPMSTGSTATTPTSTGSTVTVPMSTGSTAATPRSTGATARRSSTPGTAHTVKVLTTTAITTQATSSTATPSSTPGTTPISPVLTTMATTPTATSTTVAPSSALGTTHTPPVLSTTATTHGRSQLPESPRTVPTARTSMATSGTTHITESSTVTSHTPVGTTGTTPHSTPALSSPHTHSRTTESPPSPGKTTLGLTTATTSETRTSTLLPSSPTAAPTTPVVSTGCEPQCAWSDWLDYSYPMSGPSGGDLETYSNIRAAGGAVCEQPLGLECRAQAQPGVPLRELGQVVECSLDFGLVCKNRQQVGKFKMCFNYEIRVFCCNYGRCPSTPATSSTATPSSTPGTTWILTEPTTTAITTVATGSTAIPSSTPGTTWILTEPTTTAITTVATGSTAIPSSTPGTTQITKVFPTTTATTEATATGSKATPSTSPGTASTLPVVLTSTATTPTATSFTAIPSSSPRTTWNLTAQTTAPTATLSTAHASSTPRTSHTSTTLTTTATTTQATGSTATLLTSGTAHTSKVLTTMAITTSSTATPSSSPGTASTLTALTTTTTPTTSGYTVTPSSIPGTTHTPTVLTNTTITVATGSMATPSSSPQTTGTAPALATTGTTITATGSTTTPSSTPGTTPISPVLTTMATTPAATSTTVAPSSALGTTYTPPVLSTTATTHGRSQLPESPRTVPTARTSMATSGTTHITESSMVTSHTPVGTTGTTPHSTPALSSPHTHSRTTESPPSPGKTTPGLTTATSRTTATATTSKTRTSTLLPSSPTAAPTTPVVSTGCEPQCAWSDWLDYSYPTSGPSGGDLETYSNIRAAGGAVCEQPLGLECRAQAQPGVPLRELGQVVECSLGFGLVCRNRQQVGKFKMCFNYEIRVFCCNYGHCPSTPATSSTATPSSTLGSTWILTEPTTTAITTVATGSTTIPSSTPGTTWILTEPTTTAITTVVTGSTAIPSSTPGTTQITEVFPTTTAMTAATGSTANPSSTPGTTWILTEPTTTATITVATGSKATPSSTPASTWILTEPTTTAITTVATGSMATPSSTQGTTGSLTEPTNTATITVTTSSTAMPSSTPGMTSILTEPTTTAITTVATGSTATPPFTPRTARIVTEPTTTATITVATGSTAIPSSTPGMTSILTEPTTTAITTVATGSTATPSSTPETTEILTEATTTATITVATSSTAMPSSTPGTTLILTEPTTIAITTVAPGSTATPSSTPGTTGILAEPTTTATITVATGSTAIPSSTPGMTSILTEPTTTAITTVATGSTAMPPTLGTTGILTEPTTTAITTVAMGSTATPTSTPGMTGILTEPTTTTIATVATRSTATPSSTLGMTSILTEPTTTAITTVATGSTATPPTLGTTGILTEPTSTAITTPRPPPLRGRPGSSQSQPLQPSQHVATSSTAMPSSTPASTWILTEPTTTAITTVTMGSTATPSSTPGTTGILTEPTTTTVTTVATKSTATPSSTPGKTSILTELTTTAITTVTMGSTATPSSTPGTTLILTEPTTIAITTVAPGSTPTTTAITTVTTGSTATPSSTQGTTGILTEPTTTTVTTVATKSTATPSSTPGKTSILTELTTTAITTMATGSTATPSTPGTTGIFTEPTTTAITTVTMGSTATPSSTPGMTGILTEPTTTIITTVAMRSTAMPSSTPGTTGILTEPTTTAITTVATSSTAMPSSTLGTTRIRTEPATTATITVATSSTAMPSSTPASTWILTEPTTTAITTVATGSTALPSSTPGTTGFLTEPTTTATITVATGSTATPSSTQGTTGIVTEPTTTAITTVTTGSTATPSSTPGKTSILTELTTTAITTVATGSTATPSTPGTTRILTEPTTTAITTVATGSTATPSFTPGTTGILTEPTTTAITTVATGSTVTPSTPGTTRILTEPTTTAITTVAMGSTATPSFTPGTTGILTEPTTTTITTVATSSTATPSSTLGTTGILTEPTTTAITTVATGSTAIPSSTLGTTGIHTEPTTTATISVATSSTATPSSPPASTWFLTEPTTTAITTMASGSTATLTSTPGTTYPPKVLTITATTPTATSSKATPSSTPGTTWILTEPTTLATPTEATGSTATIPTAPSSSATPFSSPGTAGTLPVQTTTATTTMATRSTAIPSSTVGTAGTPKVLTTMATRPTATGSTVPSSSTLGTTHTPAVRPSSLPAFSVSTVSSSPFPTRYANLGLLVLGASCFLPASHACSPLASLGSPWPRPVPTGHTQSLPSMVPPRSSCSLLRGLCLRSPRTLAWEVIYNRTDRAGCQFYAVCNQHCDLDRFQGTCPTSPPPASSTLLPSPSPAPGCDNAIPPRQVNETWILENCTVARCVGDNRVALLDPKPVANVTCVNKHLPIKVSDPSQPCDFHYECECICSVWGSSHYSTFDGTSYTFEGNCTYVLMREIHARLGNLSLYLDNHYCTASAAAASCSRALSIHYKSMDIVLTVTTVHGKEEDLILFDQIPVSSGFSKNGVLVSVTGTTTMRVDIPALGVSVTFDGHIFQARLPYSLFHNNTEGQCGTCTNNQRDDCLQRDGTTATSCKDMAKTWLVPDSRKDGCWAPTGTPPTASPPAPVSSAPTPSPCPPQPLCDLMLSQVFAECHDLVPPGPFFNACISDGCQGRPEVPCQSLEAYAALCRARGVCSDWRGATGGLCDLTCPPTKVYKPCGPIQPASCNSRNQNPQLEGLAEGCFCPGDQILFSAHTGTCVQDCPLRDPLNPFQPGQQWISNCQSCVCDEGSMSVQCKPLPCEAQGPPPPCSHPSFVTVTRPRADNPCCPETVCVCNTSTCHQSPPVCPPGQELISTQKEGDCCPTLLCSERGWGGTGVGAIFPGALPCHTCTCLSGDTQDPTVQCREDACRNTTCPQGFEYKRVAGQCCGKCVQTACLTPNGPPVQLNETWINSRVDNCTVYHCEVESGVYLLTPQPASCPEVSSCRGSLRKTGCCYFCEEDSCQVRVNTTVLWHRGCKTEVNITFCEGSCPGESRYSAEAQAMQHQCTCCQERRVHEETVPLRCPDGSIVLHTYNRVDECGCTPFCVPAPMAPIYPPGFLAQEATAV